MDKKKPIGYTTEQRKSMKTLIERTQKDTGDYVGSGTVTSVPKKKKKMKRMMDGGMAMPTRGTMPNERGPMTRPGFPDRGGMRGEENRAARNAMRDEMMEKRVMSKYDRMSSRFPGYKPELASPVDTRDELKSFRMGLRDYRKANPDVKPVRPMRPGTIPRPVVPTVPPNQPAMRGGGLARKGVGMAMAAGGAVKACGAAKRGKSRGRMV